MIKLFDWPAFTCRHFCSSYLYLFKTFCWNNFCPLHQSFAPGTLKRIQVKTSQVCRQTGSLFAPWSLLCSLCLFYLNLLSFLLEFKYQNSICIFVCNSLNIYFLWKLCFLRMRFFCFPSVCHVWPFILKRYVFFKIRH